MGSITSSGYQRHGLSPLFKQQRQLGKGALGQGQEGEMRSRTLVSSVFVAICLVAAPGVMSTRVARATAPVAASFVPVRERVEWVERVERPQGAKPLTRRTSPAVAHAAPRQPPLQPSLGPEGRLVIQSLGVSMPIAMGGQATIDEGFATHWVSAEWKPPVPAGAAGTYWIDSDMVTQLGRLPSITMGAQVVVMVPGHTYTYVTVREAVFPGAGNVAWSSVYAAPSVHQIVLQTCVPGDRRLLVFGVLAGG
jgi:hypothetical protein